MKSQWIKRERERKTENIIYKKNLKKLSIEKANVNAGKTQALFYRGFSQE